MDAKGGGYDDSEQKSYASGRGEAKGEAKGGSDVAEAKGSGGGNASEAKGGGGKALDGLLMRIAKHAEKHLFGGNAELMVFVADNASEWDDAQAGERDGSGSPIKKMGTYRRLHGDFLALMEAWLENALKNEDATPEDFMKEVSTKLEEDAGFLLGPQTRDR
jgi:hypothetical protein